MQIILIGVRPLNLRVLICTVVGLCSVLLLLAMTPEIIYSPRGMVLPAKKVRAPISPHQVMIYDQAPSQSFERLGSVRAEIGFTALNQQTKDQLFNKVKSLAASIGGNGVVVNILVPNDGVRHVLTLMGTVIYLPTGGVRT